MKRKLCLFIYFIIFIRFRLAHVLTKRTKSNAKPVLSKLTGDGLHVKPSAVAQIKRLTHDANGVDRQQISYNLDLINHNGSSTLLYSQDNDVINGGLTDWSSWSECSRDCHKRSLRSRERYCINPAPSNGGADCEGERFQLDLCPVVSCSTATAGPKPHLDESSSLRSRKKDRHEKALSRMVSWRLGEWSGWDKCDCGKGYQKRYRQCYSHGGIVCPGSTIQTKACRPNVCQEPEKSSLVNVDPKDFCGFNPCDLSKCLVTPLGSCVSDYKCRPVFFDEKNKRVEECVGKRVYINPEKVSYVCKVNPCDLTRCLMDFSEERCVVGTRCQAVYYNAEGHPQKCTAILKVPVRRVCGYDPCNGEACQSRPNARCLVTSKCRPIYVNAFNERIRKCEEKAGKKSSGTEVGREEEFEAEPDSDDDEDEDGDDDVISDDRNDDDDADDDNDDDSSDDHYDNQDNDDDDNDDDYEGYRDHDNSKYRHNEKEFAYSKHRGNDPEDNDNGHGNENEDGDDDDEDGQDDTPQNTSNDRYAENFRNFLLKSGVHNNENNPQTLNSTRNNFSSNSSKTLVNLLNSENGQRRNKLNSSTISLNNINVSSLNLGDIVKGKLNSSQGVITGTVQETMKIVSSKKPTTYYYFETKGNSGKENQQVMVITAPKTKKSSVSSKRKHMNQG